MCVVPGWRGVCVVLGRRGVRVCFCLGERGVLVCLGDVVSARQRPR